MADQLENLLAEIGLHGLYNNFRTQRVEINNLSDLTDNELSRLGVTTIGDRVRLREKARERQNQAQPQGQGEVLPSSATVPAHNRWVNQQYIQQLESSAAEFN